MRLTPELVDSIAPYGVGGFFVVIAYLVFAQIMKTWRVRMVTKAGRGAEEL